MAVNNDIVANDLFKTIKGFNLNVQLFNEDGKRVIDPTEARKFYATDHKFMVTYEADEDPQSIKVYFGKNFTLDITMLKVSSVIPLFNAKILNFFFQSL